MVKKVLFTCQTVPNPSQVYTLNPNTQAEHIQLHTHSKKGSLFDIALVHIKLRDASVIDHSVRL